MENLIEIRGLVKRYDSFTLDHVDLTVPEGEIVGLIGENGAGKTTTIKALLGVIHPDSGTIRLMGRDPADRTALSKVGVVFEDSYFYGGLNGQQVSRVLEGVRPDWDKDYFEKLCKGFSLDRKKPIKDFSRGMRMKLSLATALSSHPRLLVMDEATSGLDPVIRGEILDIFLEFIQDEGCGILLSSHITTDLERVADQIAYIHQGRLLFQENKDELLESTAVVRGPAQLLRQLPQDLVLVRRDGGMGGSAALVKDAAAVRRLLPADVVVDRISIDEMMQFYGGRNEE